MSTAKHLAGRIDEAIKAVRSLHDQLDSVTAIAERVCSILKGGGTIYTVGNGGSAAEALHLAEELIGRYRGNRPPKRAICLNADATALTCIANDFGFEEVFARQCEALLRPGDGLIVLTTSGQSRNIISALSRARAAEATTIGLLGRDGGACATLCDLAIVVPSDDSAHVQEAHQVMIHLICEVLEQEFAP